MHDLDIRPKMLVKKMTTPIFEKMGSREVKPKQHTQLPPFVEYHPNYDSISPKRSISTRNNKQSEQLLQNKKYFLRKLWGSFQFPPNYMVVPKLNDK